jgi:polyhydroxyalkanoate synthesis regulator phasin
MSEENNYKDLFQKACLIQLSSSIWMGSRMLEQGLMEKIGESQWLKGRKFLVNPELLGPVKTAVHQARNTVQKHTLPFPITSLYLIPKESLGIVDEALQGYKERFWTQVNNFVDQFELAREEAKAVLGDLFDETDYPQDISTKFKFQWRFFALDLPRKTKILTPEIYQREKEKFEAMMEETRHMATEALAMELGGIVEQLVERLNGNGKARNINSSMLNKMRDFLDVFQQKNLFDDEKLNEVVAQAHSVVDGISPYGLKYNETS